MQEIGISLVDNKSVVQLISGHEQGQETLHWSTIKVSKISIKNYTFKTLQNY